MSFQTIAELINSVGAAEKRISNSYIEYLNRYFPNWNEPKNITTNNIKMVQTVALSESVYCEILFKDVEMTNPYRIDIFEQNERSYRVMLNRRNNATLIQKENNGEVEYQYLDNTFSPYLIVFKDKDGHDLKFELHLLNQIRVFTSETELLDFVDAKNLFGVDYGNRTLETDTAVFEESLLSVSLPKIVLQDISEVMVGENTLVYQKHYEDGTLSIDTKPFDDLKKGFNHIKLMYKNIMFRLTLNENSGTSNNRYCLVEESTKKNFYWLINRNGHFGMLVRDAKTDGIVPIVTGDQLEVTNYTFSEQLITVTVDEELPEELVFYSLVDGVVSEFKHHKLNAFEYEISLTSIVDNGLFVKYPTQKGQEVRRVTANRLISDIIETIKANISAKQAAPNIQFKLGVNDIFSTISFELQILNRGTKKTKTFKNEAVENTNELIFNMNLSDFPESVTFNVKDYDASIYDVLLVPTDDIDRLLIPAQRVKWHEQISEEITGHYHESVSFILAPYGTSNKAELSLRTYFIPTDALNYYNIQKRKTKRSRNKKPVVVVAESPSKAQDNGLHMFKYLINEHADELDVYYVLTEDSPDIENLVGYEKQILIYKSKDHFNVMGKVDMVLHTNSSFYAYPLNTSYWEQARLKTNKIFLQHGIIGVRDLARLYGAQTEFTNKFVVSSEREKEIVVGKMGYKNRDVVNTGLARFDNLLASSSLEKNKQLSHKLVIMPSWRKFQDRLLDDEFIETQFYKGWQAFINNQRLVKLAEDEKLEIVFYLHHNFQKYVHLFDSPVVRMIPEDEITIQELLLNNGLLITDFSSVALDFALQERKVFYYEVDDAIADEISDLAAFFPGDIYFNEDALITDVMSAIKDPSLSDSEKQKLDNLYTYRDTHARERTYEVMARMLKDSMPKPTQKPLYKRVKRRLKRLINGRK